MLTIATILLLQAVSAVPFPPPTGPYHVGHAQHIFNHTTPNDPVAPKNASTILLATIYYPTLTEPVPGKNTAPYLDPTTAKLWGDALEFPAGSLESLTTWNVHLATPLDKASYGVSQKPTIIFSPGGGENAIMYNVLNSELASHGYTVLALDHPGEIPYLQLPDRAEGVYGLNITLAWDRALQTAVYNMRVSDMLAMIRDLFPPFAESTGASFNTTHYFAIGHSLGGAAAAGAMAVEKSILGGVNLDGLFVDLPDVKNPFLMIAGEEHTPTLDPSWSPFSENQSGWYQWLNITGSSHQDFSDLVYWVDLLGLRGKTITPSLGTIQASRMDYILRTVVSTFFGFVLGEKKWLDVPNPSYPELVHINGTGV